MEEIIGSGRSVSPRAFGRVVRRRATVVNHDGTIPTSPANKVSEERNPEDMDYSLLFPGNDSARLNKRSSNEAKKE